MSQDIGFAGDDVVDLAQALAALGQRGATTVLTEGGPTVLGELIAASLVDELCLTLAPAVRPRQRARSERAPVPPLPGEPVLTGSVEEAFDALMGELVSPMVVVTTASGGTRAGCLVGFHAQCGLEPPRYAVWLSKANRTYKVAALSDLFAVHFLARGDQAIAELFGAATGDDVDKFARCSWTSGEGGVPLVDACPNRFTGRRTAWLDAGDDHVCIVLEPVEVDHVGFERQLSLSDVVDLEPGHGATERQRPR